jgi:Asp-tRNA(Asn)/Glu-tRNA(Gln) amidotransferase A subunit family amidase
METFNVLEAPISTLLSALSSGSLTSVDLVTLYLHRISAYDLTGPSLNSLTTFNPSLYREARASDARRASGLPPRKLEGIPYTLKDSFKYLNMSVSAGSPAFENFRTKIPLLLRR